MPEPTPLRALVRADASATIGHGHVMRCLALAAALQPMGVDVALAMQPHPGDARAAVEAAGLTAHGLPVAGAEADDARATAELLQRLGGVHLLVLDHYRLGRAWVQAVRPWAGTVLVIDDLADRPLDGDLLLDANWHDDPPARYAGLWPAGAATLFGPRHALLRAEFSARPPPRRSGELRRVLLSFGGSDPMDATGRCLERLHAALPGLHVDVVMGAGAPQGAALQRRWAGVDGVEVVVGASDMARRMARADLFIGAGGSMTWERACLGLPGITLPVADNQRPLCARLAAAGEGVDLAGVDDEALARLVPAVQHLGAHPSRLQAMGLALHRHCDGRGAGRVAQALLDLASARRRGD